LIHIDIYGVRYNVVFVYVFRLKNHVMKEEDGIIFLDETMESKQIEELLYTSPDIREGMVAHLRTQILRKVYKIEAEQVAGKIIQHGLCIFTEPQGNGSSADLIF